MDVRGDEVDAQPLETTSNSAVNSLVHNIRHTSIRKDAG